MVRDYEGQIALLKLRVEWLEDEVRDRERRLEEKVKEFREWQRVAYSKDPEVLLEKVHLMGIPAKDVKAMYEIEDEWHRNGGTQEMIEFWKTMRDWEALEREVEKAAVK